jgi:sugar/nucleoside kinase (ribokinase family)
MSLLVTGTIGIDTVETPAGRAERVLGGSCSYFAAAASLHAPVRVVAAVGNDWPAAHRDTLSRFQNVDLAGLEVRPDSKTFAWGGRYFDGMNDRETLFTHLGVVGEAPPRIPAQFKDSQFIFLANTHPAVQLDFLSNFPRRKLAVADTMDLWIKTARADLEKLLRQIDGVVLNYSEAEQLTGVRNAITACRTILRIMGGPGEAGRPRFVVNKKGEHGAIMVHSEGVATMPAFPAELHQVVDPTGAGDSFAGGFMGYLASAGSTGFEALQTGLSWGTVTASFTIESFGLDRLSHLTRSEIDQRMRQFQAHARVG